MDIINRTVSKNKTAVVCGCKSVTFGELDEQAEKISGALIAEGAAPGMFVPIILSRSTASAAAMLGALRSGAAFCFIDPAYPDERKQFMTENLGARIVIDEAWMNRTLNAPVAESAKTKSKAKETDPALVVYTSGSTGKPKGVVISRRVAREKLKPPFDLKEEDVFLNVSSLSFVAGSLYLMTSLHIGMTAHLAGPELLADLNNLARYIKDNAVSTAFMTPWMAAAFLQDHDGLLRMIVMASEKARRAPCGKTTLYNFYGLSETFGGVLLLKVSKPYESDVPNGKTIPGYEVELAEDGEICVSGLLADGYLNLPETTAEKFITKNGKIWLRTGDIGGVDEDGNYICRERKDWMVKVRGFRVELGEVEQAIIRLAGAKEALAKPFSGASGETALIAVYTADGPLTPNEVRAAIKRAVPDYMVPAFIERVEKIPRNANGKMDRNAIKTPDLDRYLADYAPPRNDAERALCDAFEKALDIRRVGIDDDWINLGGDSLKATALLTSLPAEIRVSTADLVAYRTPRALAEKAGGVEGGINIPLAEERDEWPVTPNEAMHLEMETHVPNNYAGHYNGALILRGNLDTERLEKALRRVFETHRLFRSVFHKQEKTWLRRVADIPKDILEKAECREEDLQAEIAKRATAFNLETGPLVRWTLFTLTGKTNQYALYHSMHHVLMDGLGLGILNDEISRYYQEGAGLPEAQTVRPDYLDFAVWQPKSAENIRDLQYWSEKFNGAQFTAMPAEAAAQKDGQKNDADPAPGISTRSVAIGPLVKKAKECGVPLSSALVSVCALSLLSFTRAEEAVFFYITNMRASNAALANMEGILANQLPLRLARKKDQSVSDFMKETDREITALLAHGNCWGSRWLMKGLYERTLKMSSIFSFNFVRPPSAPHFDGLETAKLELPPLGAASSDKNTSVMMSVKPDGERLSVEITFNQAVYNPAAMEKLNAEFEAELKEITER